MGGDMCPQWGIRNLSMYVAEYCCSAEDATVAVSFTRVFTVGA